MKHPTTQRTAGAVRTALLLALAAAIPAASLAQTAVASPTRAALLAPDAPPGAAVATDARQPPVEVLAPGTLQSREPLSVAGKLRFHVENTYRPLAVLGVAATAGMLQGFDSPEEWGQGWAAYGKRAGSTAAWLGIHNALAFGLDAALHQDPRYYRAEGGGFWQRSRHALRETILTHTDRGGETLSTWRIGSAYGSAFLSNMWYPDRLKTVRLGFIQGTTGLGFDLLANLESEFWPDIKRMGRGATRRTHSENQVKAPRPDRVAESARPGNGNN